MALPTIEISPPGSGTVSQQLAFTWNGAGDDDWHIVTSSSDSYVLFLQLNKTYHIQAYRLTAQAASGYAFRRFEITYNNDEEGSPVAGGNTYVSANLDTVKAKKEREGHPGIFFSRLIGDYSETSDGGYSYSYHVVSIKAVFDQGTPPATTYTISAYSSPQNGGTVQVGNAESGATSSQTVEVGGSVNIVATAASGYAFKGWYLGNTFLSSSATYTVSSVTAAQTFEARFVPVYTIEVVSYSSRGAVSLSGGTDESFTGFNVKRRVVESGTQVTIGAYSNNSSVWPFKAWYVVPYVGANPDNMGTLVPGAGSQYTTTVTSNIVYHATFYEGAYIYTRKGGDQGAPNVTITINGQAVSSLEVADGSSVTVSAPEDGGDPGGFGGHYYFDHWESPEGTQQILSTNPTYTFTALASVRIYGCLAYYKTHWRLVTEVSPNSSAGTITVSPSSARGDWYPWGQILTLTATPKTGFHFVKWTRRGPGTYEREVSTSSQITLTSGSDFDDYVWIAYFDRTHLLVNSSNLSTPVQLVYYESSGLLVADY